MGVVKSEEEIHHASDSMQGLMEDERQAKPRDRDRLPCLPCHLLEEREGGEGGEVGEVHWVAQSVQHPEPALDQRVLRNGME